MSPKKFARYLFQKGIAAITIDREHIKSVLENVPKSGITVLGSGKAAPVMMRAVMEELGVGVKGALIVTDQEVSIPGVEVLVATHPTPSQKSLIAAERMLKIVAGLGEDDFLLYLLSGGTSAMVEKPIPPVTLQEVQALNDTLLRCGAPIADINSVRKALSLVKGGGLARVCQAQGRVLLMSDVIGDDISVIGSAPFVDDGDSSKEAIRVLKEYALWEKLPRSVYKLLTEKQNYIRGVEGLFEHKIVASNRMVLEAIAAEAKMAGYETVIVTDRLSGDVKDATKVILQHANSYEKGAKVCLLFGGETTVKVRGGGKGGRNQELALWVLKGMQAENPFTFLSAGTDGIDGVSDAAGAIVSPEDLHEDIDCYLEKSDSYRYHKRYGTVLMTGRTGVNVMDIQIVLKG
jgi:hydroxypyruvate reductase/glycerate 2-kinase